MNELVRISLLISYLTGNIDSSELSVDVEVLCAKTLEVSCSGGSGSNGVWIFYRTRSGDHGNQNIAKVAHNGPQCHVTHIKTISAIQCMCADNGKRVHCNISGYMIAKTGDDWFCSKYSNGYTGSSSRFILTSHVPNECTPSSDKELISYTETAISTQLNNATATFSFNSVTVADFVTEFPEVVESHSTTKTLHFPATTDVFKRPSEDDNGSENLYLNTFSRTEFITIIAAAVVTLAVAANISICAYWRFKRNPNDQHTTTEMFSYISAISDENKYEHYHEIADILNERPQLAIRRNDDVLTHMDFATAIEAREPMSVLPLADINMSEGVEGTSDINWRTSCARTDVECRHYETLDRTVREDSSQYNAVV